MQGGGREAAPIPGEGTHGQVKRLVLLAEAAFLREQTANAPVRKLAGVFLYQGAKRLPGPPVGEGGPGDGLGGPSCCARYHLE